MKRLNKAEIKRLRHEFVERQDDIWDTDVIGVCNELLSIREMLPDWLTADEIEEFNNRLASGEIH